MEPCVQPPGQAGAAQDAARDHEDSGHERRPGQLMMVALIALARSSPQRKIPALQEALTGHFTDHHASRWAR